MKIMNLVLLISLLLTGCSSKYEYPAELDDSSFLKIHKNLLTKHRSIVQKDLSLSYKNWFYRIHLKKEHGFLLQNYQIVKTFYLVDHAEYILIKGNKKLIKEYKNYFKKNGATARISIKDTHTNSNNVTVLLSHNKQNLEGK